MDVKPNQLKSRPLSLTLYAAALFLLTGSALQFLQGYGADTATAVDRLLRLIGGVALLVLLILLVGLLLSIVLMLLSLFDRKIWSSAAGLLRATCLSLTVFPVLGLFSSQYVITLGSRWRIASLGGADFVNQLHAGFRSLMERYPDTGPPRDWAGKRTRRDYYTIAGVDDLPSAFHMLGHVTNAEVLGRPDGCREVQVFTHFKRLRNSRCWRFCEPGHETTHRKIAPGVYH